MPKPEHLLDITLPRGEGRARVVSRVIEFIAALPMDMAHEVQIRERARRRSDAQNRYLWGVVYKTICDRLEGWEDTDVHEYCLGEYFGWTRLTGFGKTRLKATRRSKRLNKQEFADYVAWIQRHMAEKGIYIPDPNEDLERAA